MTTDLARLGLAVDSQQVRRADRDLDRFGRSAATAERSARRATGSFGFMARGAAGLAGTVLGAVAAMVSLNAAMSDARAFSGALAEVSTLVGGAESEMTAIEEGAARLTRTFGGTATQQVQAYYQAISAGAGSASEATRLLEAANQLAIGGVTDVATAVGALSTAVNAYGAENLSAAEASDYLFTGVRLGVTTVDELAASIGNVLPIASSLGVEFQEVVAATAALTTQGLTTAQSVTGLRAALTAVTGPTNQASELARQLGLDFSAQALQAQGLAGFMENVISASGGSAEAMRTLFGSVEATTAVLALAGGGADALAGGLAAMGESAGATQAAFDLVAASMDHRLGVALATLRDVMRDLGGLLLEIVVPVLEAVASVAVLLSDNIDVLAASAGVAAAVFGGPYVLSFGAAAVATFSLTGALAVLKTALITTGIGALVVAAGYLIAMFGRLVSATGSFGAAISLLGEVASGVWEGIQTSASALPSALAGVWNGIRAGFMEMVSDMLFWWGTLMTRIAEGVGSIVSTLSRLAPLPGMSVFAGILGDGVESGLSASGTNLMGNANDLLEQSVELGARSQEQIARSQEALASGVAQSAAALQDLRSVVVETDTETEGAAEAALDLNNALEEIAGSGGGPSGGGGGSAGAAADALEEATTFAEGLQEAFENATRSAADLGREFGNSVVSGVDSVAGAWGDFVAGGLRDFEGFTQSVLRSFQQMLSEMIAQQASSGLMSLFGFGASGGKGGGLLSGLFGGSFEGGGFTGSGGRTGGIDGRGGFPAILHPNETVIDHTRSGPSGGGNSEATLRIAGLPDGAYFQEQRILMHGIAINVVAENNRMQSEQARRSAPA